MCYGVDLMVVDFSIAVNAILLHGVGVFCCWMLVAGILTFDL